MPAEIWVSISEPAISATEAISSGSRVPLRPTIRPEIGENTSVAPAIGSMYRPA